VAIPRPWSNSRALVGYLAVPDGAGPGDLQFLAENPKLFGVKIGLVSLDDNTQEQGVACCKKNVHSIAGADRPWWPYRQVSALQLPRGCN
jgi:hypothetical protein